MAGKYQYALSRDAGRARFLGIPISPRRPPGRAKLLNPACDDVAADTARLHRNRTVNPRQTIFPGGLPIAPSYPHSFTLITILTEATA
jgi:hypothetical protein